jgi:tetratricopeptide (TPR) repeat protein
LGRFENAIEDCEKAIEIDSRFIKAYVRKGNILLSNQQYQDAKESFMEGLKVNKEDSDLTTGLAKCEEYIMQKKSNLYT